MTRANPPTTRFTPAAPQGRAASSLWRASAAHLKMSRSSKALLADWAGFGGGAGAAKPEYDGCCGGEAVEDGSPNPALILAKGSADAAGATCAGAPKGSPRPANPSGGPADAGGPPSGAPNDPGPPEAAGAGP